MKIKALFVTIVLMGIVISLHGDNLADWVQKAENAINNKYTGRARDIVLKKLDSIILSKLKDDQKIEQLKREFLVAKELKITPQNAINLLVIKPLEWIVHDIAIAYDVQQQKKFLLSSAAIEGAGHGSVAQKRVTQTTLQELLRAKRKENTEKIQLNFSIFEPSTWIPKSGYDMYVRRNDQGIQVSSTKEIWDKQNQERLSQNYTNILKQIQEDKISNCHLSFSVTFRNNTSSDLVFSAASSVAVYTASSHMLNAFVDEEKNPVITIPAHGRSVIKFRGNLNNTKALELLSFMQSGSPVIRLDHGQLQIKSADGKINDAIRESLRSDIFTLKIGQNQWYVLIQKDNHKVTLREAFWAINDIFEKPKFFFHKNGKCSFMELNDFGEQFILWEYCNHYSFLSDISEKELDTPLENKKGELHFINNIIDNIEVLLSSNEDVWTTIFKKAQIKALTGDNDAQNLVALCYMLGKGVKQDMKKAFEQLYEIAQKGDCVAQATVGLLYMEGNGVKQDDQESFKWLERAAQKEEIISPFFVGRHYEHGTGVKQNMGKAIEWYQKSAIHEYPPAQYILGQCFLQGKGVEKDVKKAVEWYQKAAKQEFVEAQVQLGFCYYNGCGVEKDFEQGVKWFYKAAEQGNARALFYLGVCWEYGNGLEKNKENAVACYQAAAQQGYAAGQCELGRCYQFGFGIKKDCMKAVSYYRKAIKNGDTIALWRLGTCYAAGMGVEKDEIQAKRLIQQAAKRGNAVAQFMLGNFYKEGKGVKKDLGKAFEWYLKSANHDYVEAKYELACCYLHGTGVSVDYDKAMEWYIKAAQQNHAAAQNYLGDCYYIRADYAKAKEWYLKAAKQNYAEAEYNLYILYDKGYGVTKNGVIAKKYLHAAAEHGCAQAQYSLGYKYEKGSNIEEAKKWYRKAAEQGYEPAWEKLK